MNSFSFRRYGPPIRPFRGGWAIVPFKGEKAHYWESRRDPEYGTDAIVKGVHYQFWVSRCGIEAATSSEVAAQERGDVPQCKNCLRRVNQ